MDGAIKKRDKCIHRPAAAPYSILTPLTTWIPNNYIQCNMTRLGPYIFHLLLDIDVGANTASQRLR